MILMLHSAPYFTAIGLLALVHARNVIRQRMTKQISLGDGGDEDLLVKMRVFGNFIEWAPLGLVLLIGLEIVQAPLWYLHLCGGSLLLGRVLHSIGLARVRGQSFGRFWGMVLTITSVFLGSIGVSLFSFFQP